MGLVTLLTVLALPSIAFALSSQTLLTLTGAHAGAYFGYSVADAGDVNGDGYHDIIVGAYQPGGTDTGHAYVYYGGPGADAVADWTLTGAGVNDAFGYSVASAGDVNGDGYADVIVGSGSSHAYVFYGGSSPNAVADLTLSEGAFQFGVSVSSAGDFNGDGYADVIVGAPLGDQAFLYFGGPGADSVADLILNGSGELFGTSVAPAGDVNGDGHADVIVGGPTNGTGGLSAGRAYVFYGGPGADATADLALTGSAGQQLGNSVASAGDVNGDGYSDIIVGAPGGDRAYVYYGGSSPDAVADLTLTGSAGDAFGLSVSSAGDVNKDGYGDVIVGAYQNDAGGTDAGRAYVYFGGPGADAVADLTLTGAAAGDHFGNSVSVAGDVNGDGHSDVIVGAPLSDAGGSDAGRAYVMSLVLPNVDQSYFVPQTGTVASPTEGSGAIAKFFTCPNNDGTALSNNARIKLVVKDSGGNPISGIAASDINVRFNGGTAAQGFTGSDADSVIANRQYNPAAACPDVRRLAADAPGDASGVAYLTFKGASPSNPGVAVRDSTRKWGHYDTELPVYVLGVKLRGRLTSISSNGSYILEIKNMDLVDGLGTALNKGELINSLDTAPMQAHQGQLDSASAINWWLDLNSDGIVNTLDRNPQQAHLNHNCNVPGR